MDLLEHQGKALFAEHGVPVPDAALYSGGDLELPAGDRVVIKAQVPATKRKAAGGIRIVDRGDAIDTADAMLSSNIAGHTVDSVLLEAMVDIAEEYYLSIAIDRAGKGYTLLFSSSGGSGIEERREDVTRLGFGTAQELAAKIGDADLPDGVETVARHLFQAMQTEDAVLVEINPLARTGDGSLVATDAKVRLDDAAGFRHDYPEQEEAGTALERDAAERGLQFVELDGDVGVIGNGAGLVMATLDSIHHFGGSPANFLDIGGGADQETMAAAMDVTTRLDIDGLFINIFGGITRCDEVANGIIDYLDAHKDDLPVVVRLVGTNQERGKQLLQDAGIHAYDSMDACAEQITELVR